MAVLTIEHIVSSPDTCGGKPRIAGTRTTVQNIAVLYNGAWSIETIADELSLTLGQVSAALSYYFDHREAIDQAIREADAKVQAIALSTDEYKRRMEARKANQS